jgi:heptaprenyl diphosphate synthase
MRVTSTRKVENVNSRVSVVRRGNAHASHHGLSERIFVSAADRGLARAVETGINRVEEGLLRQVQFADPVADAPTRYLLEAGGKRVRPMLTLLIAQLGNGDAADVITAAQAIEITHLGSLYHDDVMDEAEKRRGVPSAQTVWGNSVAILTGDLLFARASQLMATLGEPAIRMHAKTFERLVLGQLHETVGPNPGEDPIAHYLHVLSDKTGSLIAAAAQAGVLFSGASPEYESAVMVFGEKVGIAFQLVDDVIDLSPQTDQTGKLPGTDLRAGISTLPLLRLRDAARTDKTSAELNERIKNNVVGAEADDPLVATTVAELRAHPATSYTINEARRWGREAVEALEPLPNGSVKKALTRFADTIVERTN